MSLQLETDLFEQRSSFVTPIKVEVQHNGVKATGRVLVDNSNKTGVHNMEVTAIRRGVPTRETGHSSPGNPTGVYKQPFADRLGLRRRVTSISYRQVRSEPTFDLDPLAGTYTVTGRGRIQRVLEKQGEALHKRIS